MTDYAHDIFELVGGRRKTLGLFSSAMSTTTTTETTTRKALLPSAYVPLTVLPMDAGTADGLSATSSSSVTNGSAGPSSGSTISTLRALYPRAAHALLQRDFALTQSLLESAFELLSPPVGVLSVPDALDMHRRKWEILRITLETSAFASPPASKRSPADDVLPPSLRANLMLSAPGLITALHARSTRLFTPKQRSPKASFLPAQILVPLVLSSLKLHCPDVARSMIEDWLALRETVESTRADSEGYERVVELFCLHVLPRIHEWEYAQEFLEYESELPDETREVCSFRFRLNSGLIIIIDFEFSISSRRCEPFATRKSTQLVQYLVLHLPLYQAHLVVQT